VTKEKEKGERIIFRETGAAGSVTGFPDFTLESRRDLRASVQPNKKENVAILSADEEHTASAPFFFCDTPIQYHDFSNALRRINSP
jgi:hypothetical protein